MLGFELIRAAQSDSRRLLVMLHGLGDSIEGYRWLPEALHLPWMNCVLVNAPDHYYGGFSWFDFPTNPEPGVKRSFGLLAKLLDDFRAKGFPTELTTLGGFSQGCVMSLEVAIRYPHRLAGVVGISGRASDPEKLIAEQSEVAKRQRIFLDHGVLDPVIPFAIAREHMQQLRQAGFQIEWHELVKAHTILDEQELHLIRNFVKAGYGEELAS